jgi:hypothetical protein
MAMGGAMANVFISHRGADQSAAERLATELSQRGHAVWLDTWKIKLGDSIIERIDSGLSAASYLVLCCSATPSASAWMDREWMSVLSRQLEGADVRVLPVRLTGGEVPVILADVKYADLSEHWQKGVDAICKALG